ncbi:MAG: hypothetical protein WED05_05405 [Candidatus Atabeyarchaeum deiterrae]
MVAVNEDQLISTVKQVFTKTKSKFCKADKMEQLLVQEGLTPEEAKQAISIAEDKYVIRVSFPYIDERHGDHIEEIHGDRCYEIVTKRDLEDDKEQEKEFLKKPWP